MPRSTRIMSAPLLEVRDLRVRFGGVTALDGVSLDVRAGSIAGLIGPNGAGKSTFFNCLTGFCAPDAGSVALDGRDLLSLPVHRIAQLGVIRTFQNLQLFASLTVRENLLVGAHHRLRASVLAGLVATRGQRSEDLKAEAWAVVVAQRVSIHDHLDSVVAGLPYGTRKLVELGRALMAAPRVLMLDEPAAGLTAVERGALVHLLRNLRDEGVTVVLVDHEMDLVRAACDIVHVLDFGRLVAGGDPEAMMREPAVREAYLGDAR